MKSEAQQDSVASDKSKGSGRKRGAAVRFPPPAIFLLLIVTGLVLDAIWALPTRLPALIQPIGYLLIVAGIAMVLIVADVFKKHQTAIQPWKTTTVLVTDGLYARSRNPIYAGFCLVNVGLGLVADNLWLVLSALPGAWLVTKIAIEKEEAYLEQVFGQEYLDYKDKVRRWL